MQIRFFSNANKPYFTFLEGCVKSSLFHYKEALFDVHLLNPNKEDISKFENISQRVKVYSYLIDWKKKKINERIFCGNFRNKLFAKYMNNDEIVVWVDADCIFKKFSQEWFSAINNENYDIIAYKFRNRTYLSGIIVCRNTTPSKNFIYFYSKTYDPFVENTYKKIKKITKGSNWMLDQNAYKYSLNFLRTSGLRILDLSSPIYDSKIMDERTAEGVDIWLPIREKHSDLFKKELASYLRLEKVD